MQNPGKKGSESFSFTKTVNEIKVSTSKIKKGQE